LIHPEFDRFDWIWRTNGVMLCLVGFNEGSEHIQFVSILGARLRVHELFNAMQGSFMVSLCLNGSNGHGASWDSDGRDIDGVVVRVTADETNIDDSIRIVDFHNQAVVVSRNIERYSVSLKHAC
jgi:hypothetical protein